MLNSKPLTRVEVTIFYGSRPKRSRAKQQHSTTTSSSATVAKTPYRSLPATIKFIYSEKVTKFCEISILDLTVCTLVKFKVEISQKFFGLLRIYELYHATIARHSNAYFSNKNASLLCHPPSPIKLFFSSLYSKSLFVRTQGQGPPHSYLFYKLLLKSLDT